MSILILSCNTGGGHNSCARAIKAQAKTQNVYCEVTNGLSFSSRLAEHVIVDGHIFGYRHFPKMYGSAYKVQEKHPALSVFELFCQKTDKLQEYLTAHEQVNGKPYDAVISVHVFPALMMTGLRESGKCTIPSFFVATDYTCSPSVNTLKVDRIFIPYQLTDTFAAQNIPRDMLCETGIPVSPDCYHPVSREDARKTLGLPQKPQMVLISCGSMGAGNMSELAMRLLKVLPETTLLAVLTGTNKVLYRHLQNLSMSSRLIPIPFTSKVGLWMSAADLLISKPGGLTSTEAATRGLPVLFMDAIPGLETYNLNYMVYRGLAAAADNKRNMVEKTADLLNQPQVLRDMSKRQREYFAKNSAQQLLDVVESYFVS